MHRTGYELEIAQRRIREFQDQAAKEAMLKEYKETRRKNHKSFLGSLIGNTLVKLHLRSRPYTN